MLNCSSGCRKNIVYVVIILSIIAVGGGILFILGGTVPPEQNGSSQALVNTSQSGSDPSLFVHWQNLTYEKPGARTVTEEDMITFITKWNQIRNWGASDAEILASVKALEKIAISADSSVETISFIRLGKKEWDEYEYAIDHMPKFCAEVARLLGQSETEVLAFPDAVLIDEWEERFGCKNSNVRSC